MCLPRYSSPNKINAAYPRVAVLTQIFFAGPQDVELKAEHFISYVVCDTGKSLCEPRPEWRLLVAVRTPVLAQYGPRADVHSVVLKGATGTLVDDAHWSAHRIGTTHRVEPPGERQLKRGVARLHGNLPVFIQGCCHLSRNACQLVHCVHLW